MSIHYLLILFQQRINTMIKDSLIPKITNIKLLVSDVDGVLTDGKILISSNKIESKFFSVEDGTGAALARYANLPIALISGRYSECTEIRAKELKIEHCFQNTLNKKIIIEQLISIYSVNYDEIAYIGDSLVDLPVLEKVGFPICVPNSHKLVEEVSEYITHKKGGDGVLLEVVELLLNIQKKYHDVLNRMKKDKFE